MKVEDIIEELLTIISIQGKEIKRLNQKLHRITQYIEAYEEYIKKDDVR